MAFESELGNLFYDMEMQGAEQRGIERLNDLNAWLFANGRGDDVQKAAFDANFRETLFSEYDTLHPAQ